MQSGAAGDGVGDVAVHDVALSGVDQWAQDRGRVVAVAEGVDPRRRYQGVDELVRDVAVHVDSFHGCADLPGVDESAEGDGLGGRLRVDVGVDDDRVPTPEFEDRPVQHSSAGGTDVASGLHRAGEMHQLDLFVLDERPTRGGIAQYEVTPTSSDTTLPPAPSVRRGSSCPHTTYGQRGI